MITRLRKPLTSPKLHVAAALSASVLGLFVMTQSCSTRVQTPSASLSLTPQDAEAAARRADLEQRLRAIAQEYSTSYRRVSAQLNWSPIMCRMPDPPTVKFTDAPDGSPHGRKLYFLYARDAGAYATMSRHGLDDNRQPITNPPAYSSPVGQAVVKEAFTPVSAVNEFKHYQELRQLFHADPKGPGAKELERYAHDDHNDLVRTGDLAALFVMLKLDPATPGTDQGWVYATIAPDLTTITSLGVIESCMNCHKQTDRDRLYGDKESWPERWPGTPENPKSNATPPAPASK